MDEDTIQIPISEYEKFRSRLMYEDKQSLIRELQQLLQDKEQDLQRYKDKLDHTDSVLQRTQKQLDKFIQINKVDKPVKLLVPRSMGRPAAAVTATATAPRLVARDPQVASRALNSKQATEHDETTVSMPPPTTTSRSAVSGPSDHLKSLPVGLGISGFAPGMSTALLQKLVAENLRLRKQLEALNDGKPIKLTKDSQVQELKWQLKTKESQLDELRAQLKAIPLGKDSDPSSNSSLSTYLLEKVQHLQAILDLDKFRIASLNEQNDCIAREKSSMETLLETYRTYDRQVENRYNENRITELETELETRKKAHDNTVTKLESVQSELDSIKPRLETLEQERDIAVQNYEIIVSEFQNIRPSVHQTSARPGSIPRQAFTNPASSSSYTQAKHYVLPTRAEPQSSSPSSYSSRHRGLSDPPALPPRIPTQHSRSTSSNSASTAAAAAPPPPPRDSRRVLKCPRCELVFDLLQSYREHIKVCLTS